MSERFQKLKDVLIKSFILIYADSNKLNTLFMDTLKHVWCAVFVQVHSSVTDGKTIKHQHPIIYINGLLQVVN